MYAHFLTITVGQGESTGRTMVEVVYNKTDRATASHFVMHSRATRRAQSSGYQPLQSYVYGADNYMLVSELSGYPSQTGDATKTYQFQVFSTAREGPLDCVGNSLHFCYALYGYRGPSMTSVMIKTTGWDPPNVPDLVGPHFQKNRVKLDAQLQALRKDHSNEIQLYELACIGIACLREFDKYSPNRAHCNPQS